MAEEYRAYEIGPDNHIISRIDLVCEDDVAAKERARQLADAHPIELWRGDTRLGLFKPMH